jgi:hypothetical protein
MPRFCALLLALPVVGICAGAPVPPHARNPVLYFPTTVGSKSVYQQGDEEVVETVTAVERTKEGFIVNTERSAGDGTPLGSERVRVSEGGVFRIAMGKHEFAPPLCALKLPLKTGEPWAWETNLLGADVKGKCAAFPEEKVEVPAGTFAAIRVEWNKPAAGGAPESTWWFAPGIGLIKRSYGKCPAEVLKSFAPGR